MATVNTLGETDLIGDLNKLAGLTGGAIGNTGTKKIEASSTSYLNSSSPRGTSSDFDRVILEGEGLLYDANNLPIGGTINSIEIESFFIGSRGQHFIQRSEIKDISLDGAQLRSGTLGDVLFNGDDTAILKYLNTGFSSRGVSFSAGEGNDTIVFANGGEVALTTGPAPLDMFVDSGEGNDTITFDFGQAPTVKQTVTTGIGSDVIKVGATQAVLDNLSFGAGRMRVTDFDPQFDRLELPVGANQSGPISWRVEADGADTKLLFSGNDAAGMPISQPVELVLSNVTPDQITLGADGVVTGVQAPVVGPVFGTEGADVLFGNPEPNIIVGLGGDDAIITYENNDVLIGGEGNDSLDGGAGKDQLFGDNGNDQIFAGGGDDVAFGGFGDDLIVGDAEGTTGDDGLFGEDGNDLVYAGFGKDFVSGGNGDDVLFGETGSDEINGDAGNDTLFGGSGFDLLNGGDGADSLDGGTENDKLYGGADDDQLFGDAGDDVLFGGTGNDLLVGDAEGTSGADSLYGESGNDIVYAGFGNDYIDGGSGDDLLFGETGRDRILGGYGDDIILGGTGNDALFGGNGDDVIDGGDGHDSLDGGAGNDTLFAGEGTLGSTLNGNVGNDILRGGEGHDKLIGGSGFDIVSGGGSADQFYLRTGSDFNIWQDFEDGIDRIVVGGLSNGSKSGFDDLRIFETLDGTGTWIGYEDTQLILEGVDTELIDEEDFSFG